jgi:hypothetical protein
MMRFLPLALLCFGLSVSSCNCLADPGLNPIEDAGVEPTDAGPPPPVFPLIAGDIVEYPVIGGRVNQCNGGGGENGECELVAKITYRIDDVVRGDDGRWTVNAEVLYEAISPRIPGQELVQLVLENVAPFSVLGQGQNVTTDGPIAFATDKPALYGTDLFTANDFPFFQMALVSNGEVLQDSGIFDEAAATFASTYTGLDPAADVETQVAAGKMEAYFKDELGGDAKLHHLAVEYLSMGLVCGWTEKLIAFTGEDMPRNASAFTGQGNLNPPLAGTFAPPSITRDGAEYRCSCFSGVCRNSADNTCLDPANPDAPAGACP